MENRNLQFTRSSLFAGSLLALGLSASACGASDAPVGSGGHPSYGRATTDVGGPKGTGGAKSVDAGAGGSGAGGSIAASGGSRATGGTESGRDGTGGSLAAAAGSADAGEVDSCVPESLTVPSNIPQIIQTPEGVTLIHHLHAAGTQDYKCTATAGAGDAGTTYSWVFIAPEAVLSDDCGNQVGKHFAGSGGAATPRWQYTADGSFVQGVKVQASPVAGSIPALLLAATQHSAGAFGDVTYVQRLDPAGGAAPPAAECNAGNADEVEKVGYSADYYFYTGGLDGGTH
jgi:hypothetical protein